MTYSREFAAAVHIVRMVPALALMCAAALWLAGCFGERVAVEKRETDKASVPGTYFLVKNRLPILDRTGMVLASTHGEGGYERCYPWKDLARSVLGEVDGFGHGLSGVEYSFDTRLTPGLRPLDAALEGLYLSLDVRVQQETERLLSWQMKRLKAAAGSMVIMDVETGEILAMASREFSGKKGENRPANLAVEGLMDPWPVPVLAAIKAEAAQQAAESSETDAGDSDSKAASKPSLKEGQPEAGLLDRPLKWHWTNFDSSSGALWCRLDDQFIEAMKPPEGLLASMVRLGFGQKTGIELPDEQLGLLPTALPEHVALEAGSGIKASPLQTLVAFCRLITGRMISPTIVRRDESSQQAPAASGHEDDQAGRRAQEMLLRLTGDHDSPAVASVRRPGRPGGGNEVVSLGFWPSDSPKVALITVLWDAERDPRVKKGTLGRASSLLRLAGSLKNQAGTPALAAAPEETGPGRNASDREKASTKAFPGIMPDLRGRSLRLAFEELQALGLTAEIQGAGIVTEQYPSPGEKISPGSVCRLKGRSLGG